jgi:hypothetical protein
MALIKCKECGEKVSSKAKACPKCGAKPKKKTSFLTWFVLVLFLLIVGLPMIFSANMTPEEQAAYEAQRAEERAASEAERIRDAELLAQEKAEEQRKGFHCLSSWDGSHTAVKQYVQERMRDPKSFDHVQTRITPVDQNGEHVLAMEYRAANGFGGLTIGIATAVIDNATCQATITSLE